MVYHVADPWWNLSELTWIMLMLHGQSTHSHSADALLALCNRPLIASGGLCAETQDALHTLRHASAAGTR